MLVRSIRLPVTTAGAGSLPVSYHFLSIFTLCSACSLTGWLMVVSPMDAPSDHEILS